MRRLSLMVFALLCAVAVTAQAEQLTLFYTEPAAVGTLAKTTVYWCRNVTCTSWTFAGENLSDNGNGGDAKSVSVDIPLTEGTLPLTIRLRATSTTTSGNESAGAFTTHTFL